MSGALEHPEWFIAWVGDYGAAFGVSDELRLTMLRIWWPAFAAVGYYESDFAAALTALVAGDNPPNWPREHLAAVNRELRSARDRRTRRAQSPTAPEGDRCTLCGWTGWVTVPHPEDVFDGQWNPPYRTGAVACTRCGPGSRKYHAARECAKTPPLTLDHYELRVDSAWADHLAERTEAERLMLRAMSATEATAPSGFPKLARAMASGAYKPTERRNQRAAS